MSGVVPTGTVTLLLADAEGSTRLWESAVDQMTAAFANLDQTLSEVVSSHNGVRPVEQGEGDSFVVAFTRASDAVACALALQQAPLAPIRLRIGLHTGEVQLRDEGNYIGPAINRTARLRELAHGGQTVLSGTTSDLVADLLPDGAWLNELGTHPLRDLPRPERVVQLCHPDLHNQFPPLRIREVAAGQQLPMQLTSFVGRADEMAQLAELLNSNRSVTLTGAGGVGKTRLAVQVVTHVAGQFRDGAWYVDLAPVTDPETVRATVGRALGLPDLPGRSALDTLLGYLRDRHLLVVLDNCEHLLDASAEIAAAVLSTAPGVTVVATSREPLGLAGEATFRVPSLSLADDALTLFTERARLARNDFSIADDNATTVREICMRLDGMPLAIELAAARVRALSLEEILDGLRDRFRLLTGGSRTAVRRQQTLHASVEWSHALLTEAERVLFRRLAVFRGSFDLDAAEAVVGTGEVERYQVLDQLTLLVDKSLVAIENLSGATRYRLLETMRQYSQEKLGESGEADEIRGRHRDYYTAMAARLDDPTKSRNRALLDEAERDLDNLRAAFEWSREDSGTECALLIASALQPIWVTRGRLREGMDWLDAALSDAEAGGWQVTPAVRARALADRAWIDAAIGSGRVDEADQALELAREIGEPALLARALVACGAVNGFRPEVAGSYFAEGIELARSVDDGWLVGYVLGWQSFGAIIGGHPKLALAAAEEGRLLADSIGDSFVSRLCRYTLSSANLMCANITEALEQSLDLISEASASHDLLQMLNGSFVGALALAFIGRPDAARAVACAAIEPGMKTEGTQRTLGYWALGFVELADGHVAAASEAMATHWDLIKEQPESVTIASAWMAQAALACGDLAAAWQWADEAVAKTLGWQRSIALLTRARVGRARGGAVQSERDLYAALADMTAVDAHLGLPDVLECLATPAIESGRHHEAARLFGAADSIRQRSGEVRFKVYQADYEDAVAAATEAMGEQDFAAARSEGAALTTDEAIAYVQRGRGERKRPATGWDSLTPTEWDVVRLVSEGLGNKEIGARLFVSHRTVQTHLTHVYTKLGVTSRMQLAQEAARHQSDGNDHRTGDHRLDRLPDD